MKKFMYLILLLISLNVKSQIVYINNHDEVFSKSLASCVGSSCLPTVSILDIEKDDTLSYPKNINLLGNIRFNVSKGNFGPYSCTNENAPKNNTYCIPIQFDIRGLNTYFFDVYKNDTIDYKKLNNSSTTKIIAGGTFTTQTPGLCIGNFGLNRIGFAINKIDPSTGRSGYLFGYIEYTLLSIGDVIIHGWYYNKKYNEPIIVNSDLHYPYNGCIYQDTTITEIYDTIKVEIPEIIYDTVKVTVTNFIYDTIKVEIPEIIYDTVTVYDTIIITIYDTTYRELNTNNLSRYDIKIYPNPSSEFLQLESMDIKDFTISISDISGKIVHEDYMTDYIKKIDLSNFSNGDYLINLESSSFRVVKIFKIKKL